MLRRADHADLEPLLAFLKANKLVLEGINFEHFWVQLEDGVVTASGGLEVYGEVALLRSVAVAVRGQGLGRELVQQLLEYAKSLGVNEVVLLTKTAESFFAKIGFVVSSREAVSEAVKTSVEFRGACPDSAVVMRLGLTGESSKNTKNLALI
jgi:amino-acid N-acetyltransferase